MIDLATFQNALTHWRSCSILKRLPGGYRNTAYLIECQGKLHVAKSTRRSPAALAWLNPVYDLAEAAGLRVPRLVPCADGRLAVSGITVEKFLDGTPPTPSQLADLLPRLQEFHTLAQALPQRPGFAASTQLLHTPQGGDVDLSQMPPALVAHCRQQWQAWADAPQSVVHGDVSLNNLLVTESGQFGLVDWDEARVDLTLFDVLNGRAAQGEPLNDNEANLLLSWEIAVCWLVEPAHARRLAAEFGHKVAADA